MIAGNLPGFLLKGEVMYLTDVRLLDRIKQMVDSAQFEAIRVKFTTSSTTALLFEELNLFFQQCDLGPEVVTSVTTIFLDEEDQRVWGVNLPWYWRCVRINSHTFRTQLDQVWGYKTEIRLVPGELEFLRVLDSATGEVLGGWNRLMSGDYHYFMVASQHTFER